MMESGSDRPGRNTKGLGDLLERPVEVVVKHHHRAMFDGKPAKAALELVAINDLAQALAHRRLVSRQEAEVRRRLAVPATLGVAGTHEEPVRPGVEARRVAEIGEVPPDVEQRLLRRILGEVDVAQDPVRNGVEPTANGYGEARKGLLVAILRPDHKRGIHVPSPSMHRSRRIHGVWGGRSARRLNLCARRAYHRPMATRVTPADRSTSTGQNADMERSIAVSSDTVGSIGLYSSVVTTAAGGKTRIHHHGECETSIYIVSGLARYTWGPTGLEQAMDAGAGDFIYIPAGEIHVEENASSTAPLVVVLTRNCPGSVVHYMDDGPDGAEDVPAPC
jgi:uncharacterized RmlC-like cupin family protein